MQIYAIKTFLTCTIQKLSQHQFRVILTSPKMTIEVLDFLLDEVREKKPLILTLVFFNTRDCAYRAYQYIKSKIPEGSPYLGQIFSIRGRRVISQSVKSCICSA